MFSAANRQEVINGRRDREGQGEQTGMHTGYYGSVSALGYHSGLRTGRVSAKLGERGNVIRSLVKLEEWESINI